MVRIIFLFFRLISEISESPLFNSEENINRMVEKLKKENKELYNLFSWLEEIATIKIKEERESKIKLKKYLLDRDLSINLNKINLHSVKQILSEGKIKTSWSWNEDDSDDTEINSLESDSRYLNFSEECIAQIEEPTFDIFKLENEVGEENTLATISCYIFSTNGLYSLINYQKFEQFIHQVSKGYRRENPYHNVKLNINVLGFTCSRRTSKLYDIPQKR